MAIGGGTLSRRLEVVITGTSRGLSTAFGSAGKSADTFAAKLRRGVGRAAPFAAVGLGLVALQAKQGVAGVMEDEKALANLESTLKSTGNTANITANGFFKYANELQAATGVGADQITQGAALLGTFKNVRNEVGKGNQVFTRATEAALDLSKKGFGNLESSNKMLGKALQDPTRGITALSRAGVTFSDQQKEQIKTMQESGDLLGAQKLILQEVEGQVKGTAKAYGETTAGQVDRAARAFEELQKALAVALLPIITTVAGWISKLSGFMQKNERLVKIAILAFTGLAVAILAVNAALKVIGAISALSNPIVLVALAIGAITVGVIALYKRSATFRKIVTGAWEAVKSTVETVVGIFDGPVKAAFRTISGVARALGNLLKGDFSGAWDAMKDAASGVIEWIKSTILALPATILTAAVGIGRAIVNGIKNGVATLGNSVWDAIKGLPANLLGRVGGWLEGLKTIGGRVITYIKSGVTGLAAAAWDSIAGMPRALIGYLGGWAEGLSTIGGRVISGIKSGVTGMASAVWEKIKGFPATVLGWVTEKIGNGIKSIGTAIKDLISEGISGIGNAIKSAIGAPLRAMARAIVKRWPNVPGLPGPPQWLKNLQTVALAKGGIVTGPLNALIGEAGPEAVIPLSGSGGRNALARAMEDASAQAGGGGMVINLTVHGVMAGDMREFAQRLKPELARVLTAGY